MSFFPLGIGYFYPRALCSFFILHVFENSSKLPDFDFLKKKLLYCRILIRQTSKGFPMPVFIASMSANTSDDTRIMKTTILSARDKKDAENKALAEVREELPHDKGFYNYHVSVSEISKEVLSFFYPLARNEGEIRD